MITVGMFIADRYEIVGKVGAGGMSDVYKAKDHILGRFVAIKVLKAEFSEDMNFVTKFRTEAQSAAGLEHPNIVNIYDVGSEDGIHYIVMEYVEGITLKTYIEKKGRLSFKESVSIAIQVARGIDCAHAKNIIHRDIKPQNIIISTEGKVKVTDFGIARAASANTISADVMGSVHYASPEQARNGFVDGRSDIYSLGIVMYEMITGRVPFDGDTTVAVAIQHLQEEMVMPSIYAPDIPVSFEKIIIKCTQKNADRRYQSLEELLGDLRKSLTMPDEDFVVIAPLTDNGKTKVITGNEISEIKNRSVAKPEPSLEPAVEPAKEAEEEEQEGILSPKMDKAVTVAFIITIVIIVCAIVGMLLSFLGLFNKGKSDPSTETQTESQTNTASDEDEMVKMIKIVGMSQEDAEKALKELGLSLIVTDIVESEEEDGTVLSQNVEQGMDVAKNSVIQVTIAGNKEGEMVDVPNVVGYTVRDAINVINEAGLKYDIEYTYDDAVAADTVMSQTPASGQIKKGEKITLVVSQGVESAEVPDVVGKTEKKAKQAIEKAGFKVEVVEEYSDSVAAGKVIRQSITGQSKKGTTVTIYVSKGQETVYYKYSDTYTYTGAIRVTYTLTEANGNVHTKTVDGSSVKVSISDMLSKSGTLVLEWVELDSEGNEKTTTQTYEVSFTKQ